MRLARCTSAGINGSPWASFLDGMKKTLFSDYPEYVSPLGTHRCVPSKHSPIRPHRAASVLSSGEIGYQSLAEWIHSHVSASNGQLVVCRSTWRLLASPEVMVSDCVELVDLMWALQLKTGIIPQDKVSGLKTVLWWSTRLRTIFHGSWLILEWAFNLNGDQD